MAMEEKKNYNVTRRRRLLTKMLSDKMSETTEYIDQTAFDAARQKIIGKSHNDKGIGTLSEKTLHAVLKAYYEPDEDKHEVALDGYYADIFNEHGVIEIQPRQLNKLRDKLSVFLNDYNVRVVYPMAYEKYLSWIDPESGAVSSRRKSPKRCTMYDAIFELYKIKPFLKNPNLSVTVLMMDMEEYKLLNGWSYDKKRGAERFDRIPVGIRKIVKLDCPQDYMQFVPDGLESGFTSADFASAAHIDRGTASDVLGMLNYMEQVRRVGKKGNAFIYDIVEHY